MTPIHEPEVLARIAPKSVNENVPDVDVVGVLQTASDALRALSGLLWWGFVLWMLVRFLQIFA